MNKVLRAWRKNKFLSPYTVHNTVEWIQSGKKFFDCLELLIDSAKNEIHLQVYIFASDETGIKITEALIRAAERKVQVFIIVDAYGSQTLSSVLIRRMQNAGINLKKYGELYSKGSFHIGRRMHHKIIVIDGLTSVVGGLNISNHYNDDAEGRAWLDFAVVMRGDISRRLQFVCRKRWSGWEFSFKARKKLLKIFESGDKIREGCPIRIRRNDFIRNKLDITISYREALRLSEKSLLLIGGYFLPGGRTRRLMRKAIDRGVEINVVVSEKSDVQILIYARRYLYAWLIRNGIGVYEYKPSNVHGKVLIADEKWTTIGSYDLNNLSTYSNIELNVDINDQNFAKSLSKHIHGIMASECKKVTEENFKAQKSPLPKFAMWVAYRFIKTLFVLSVLLAGKKEKEF
jgi:cardiolipin synthase